MNKVLVIAPHPDDETLGCGGTLLRHKSEGDIIYWCIVTDMKESYGFTKDKVEKRQNEIKKVSGMYGFEDVFNLSFRPMGLTSSSIPALIKAFGDIISKIKPNILYIPHYNDPHSDHRIVFDALRPYFKSFRYPFIKKILMMEIPSETDHQFISSFQPNVFVDISNFIDDKIEIMKVYESEVGEHPFPRSVESIRSVAICRGS